MFHFHISYFQALQYCEVISQAITKAPQLYDAALLRGVHTLATHLKLCGPQQLQNGEEVTDLDWLSELAALQRALQVSVF